MFDGRMKFADGLADARAEGPGGVWLGVRLVGAIGTQHVNPVEGSKGSNE